jgi:glycosyltransferase involved in cell wall biosynthesis
MASLGFKANVEQLAHPMLPPVEEDCKENDGDQGSPVVRVLGQFKRDRDLGALVALAEELGPDVQLEIVGRGWPELEGWKVDSRFVSEAELDELMRTSSAVVIPYVRFYQSGIAIRALESNTPIVGRAETSLADLYGRNSRLLVTEDPATGVVNEHSWVEAVRYAVAAGREEAARAAAAYHSVAVSEWGAWDQRVSSMEEGS